MNRFIAILTLLFFVPQTVHAQATTSSASGSVSASAYVQTEVSAPLASDASASEVEFAIEERIARAEAAASEENWREATRAMREAQRLDGSAQRVRLAHLGVRNRVAPSLVLQLDPALQQELLHHVDTGDALTTAGHVFGVIGAASALVGVVFIVVGAIGLAFVAALGAIFGSGSSGSLDGLAPIVGICGGVGLGLAAVGGGFHLAAGGENHAIRVALHPQASAEGGGIAIRGTF